MADVFRRFVLVSLGRSCCGSTWSDSIHHVNLLFTDIHPVNAMYSLENASLNKLKKKYTPSSANIFGVKKYSQTQ
jgi:hypothetical protein